MFVKEQLFSEQNTLSLGQTSYPGNFLLGHHPATSLAEKEFQSKWPWNQNYFTELFLSPLQALSSILALFSCLFMEQKD